MSVASESTRPELTARGRVSRDRLVSSAMTLMLEQGVSATSIDEVLDHAQASKSQMYHYFSGKHELVDAVITRARATVLHAQQPYLGAIDSFEALHRWADHVVALNVEFGSRLGCPLGTLAGELAAADEDCRADLDASFAAWTAMIRAGLDSMRFAGELAATADIDRLATAVITSVQGGLLIAKTTRDSEPLRIALDAALAYVERFRPPVEPQTASSTPAKRKTRGRR